ncbi:uncharacterized protein LOC117239019 [Bombus vosnesenskii]|uniref:Uncharacterized protein LOC117239019 n=1 Tax=Bombus vosnesenskii TaxID=207650 RepID=A0A6J3L4H4_9HYME|nr:uncharacterized protein LOC117239019 [Bombus vosnesenskii]
MAGETVQVGSQMKYLGLVIDSQWTFEPHFDSLIPKVSVVANAIGEAGDAVRRLYEGVVRSRVMYGAPVWADDLMASRRSILLLRRLHRVTAIRIIRVWHLGKDQTEQAAPNDIGTAEEDTWDLWRSQLIEEGGEHRGAEAVLPNWEAWRSRHGLPLTFRLTQVLTGHGVFSEFLKRIGRETTDICHHCGEGRDTAQHTLELCPAWELPRYTLRHAIGGTLTTPPPPAIVEAMLRGPQEYEAVRLFCKRVMLAKELRGRRRSGRATLTKGHNRRRRVASSNPRPAKYICKRMEKPKSLLKVIYKMQAPSPPVSLALLWVYLLGVLGKGVLGVIKHTAGPDDRLAAGYAPQWRF